ncbi:MAG: hypothetical protein JSU85_10730 [Candidatus Zixiibacteriota bacterium]|nr:MAG: hypothetical protein JSU85_10730 [candidate division Zixibacteria bacterium]
MNDIYKQIVIENFGGSMLCPSCLQLFSVDKLKEYDNLSGDLFYLCPNKKCGNKQLFIVDDLMIETIILLNRKNYRTVGCCSGHITDLESSGIYIEFDKEIKDIIVDLVPPNSSGLRREDDIATFVYYLDSDIVTCKTSPLEKMKYLYEGNRAFYEWAEQLNPLNFEYASDS